MDELTTRQVRRLALCRAGLLAPTDLPSGARGSGASARRRAHAVIDRFGYLQLDTVSIAGARSHAIVLLSRLRGMPPSLGEELLRPGEPLFEYWGHEACWMPLDLYPAFEFRRVAFRTHRGGATFSARIAGRRTCCWDACATRGPCAPSTWRARAAAAGGR